MNIHALLAPTLSSGTGVVPRLFGPNLTSVSNKERLVTTLDNGLDHTAESEPNGTTYGLCGQKASLSTFTLMNRIPR